MENNSPSLLRALLVRWAEINSGSGNPAGLDAMRAALASEFATLPGASVTHLPLQSTTAQALRVQVRPAAPRQILLSGHYDTVFGPEHAFQTCTQLDADTLRGPGVTDMKGGLVTMLAALREFEGGPLANQLGYEILLTPDEETGSLATRALIEQAARAGFALGLVFEPARGNGDIVRKRKGTGCYTIACHGRAAHAGRDPKAGRNAILALGEFLRRADELNGRQEGLTLNVGNIRGGGPVNIVPDFAIAQVDARIARVAHVGFIEEQLGEIADAINAREGYRVEVSGGFNRPPKEISPVEEKLFHAWQACAAQLGLTVGWQDVGGGSDGNLLAAAGLPVLDGLGPVGDHVHSPNEFIMLPTLAGRAAVTARFLTKFAAAEIAV
ncbi:MAG TPA: hydrolase [Opitutaceae bacterium]|nr:hydrolase [Opitutaceae bacterium]